MFKGVEVALPLADFGIVGTKNLANVPPNALLKALNVAFDQGVITRAGGSAKGNATPITGAPQVRGFFDYWPTPTVQRPIVLTGAGELRRNDDATLGSFPTLMKSGLNGAKIPVFAEGGAETFGNNKKLFVTTGADVVQVVDGDAGTSRDLLVANKPADWSGTNQPRGLVQHNRRMVGWLLHRIYWTTGTDHENYVATGAGQLPVLPGFGSFVQGACSFKSRLIIWKFPRGIAVLDDTSLDSTQWEVRTLTTGAGLAGVNAWCIIDDDILFMSEIGHIHLLSGVTEFGDIGNSDLIERNLLTPWIEENLNLDAGALEGVQAQYFPVKKEAHFTVQSKGSTVYNWRLVVDLNFPDRPRIRLEDKDTVRSIGLWRDAKGIQRLVSGDDTGTVWKLDQATKDKAGLGYSSEFQTPHTDLGFAGGRLATVRKNYKYLEAVMQPLGNFDLSVDVLLDSTFKQTVLFNMGQVGAVLGSFIIGTDALGGDNILNVRKRIRGASRRISLLGRMSVAGADFAVSAFYLGCKPGRTKT